MSFYSKKEYKGEHDVELEKLEPIFKQPYEDCDCEDEHEQCICNDCREHAEYCEEHGTDCCGARMWI